jgi:hypothetical protein
MKNIIWNKTWTLQNIKKENDLDLNTKMPKHMANASFYRLKFRNIDLMTNCWVGGYILTWWQSLSSCLNNTSLLTSPFEQIIRMKFLGNCLSFPTKQESAHLDFKNSRYWLNTEQCLGCRTNSDFSVVATI